MKDAFFLNPPRFLGPSSHPASPIVEGELDGQLTGLLDVVMEILVVYNDRAVSVVRRVRRFPILVLVEGFLVLVEPDITQKTVIEISR